MYFCDQDNTCLHSFIDYINVDSFGIPSSHGEIGQMKKNIITNQNKCHIWVVVYSMYIFHQDLPNTKLLHSVSKILYLYENNKGKGHHRPMRIQDR